MTQDDVIQLARDAGMVYREFEDEFANANTDGVDLETMTDFAKLVAEHEREACAKLCDDHCGWTPRMIGSTIRARK